MANRTNYFTQSAARMQGQLAPGNRALQSKINSGELAGPTGSSKERALDDFRHIKSFNEAFGAARKSGLKQFRWGKGVYGTQLANEVNPQPARRAAGSTPAAQSQQAPVSRPTPNQGETSNQQVGPTPISEQGPYRPQGSTVLLNRFGVTTGSNLTAAPSVNPTYETEGVTRSYPFMNTPTWSGANRQPSNAAIQRARTSQPVQQSTFSRIMTGDRNLTPKPKPTSFEMPSYFGSISFRQQGGKLDEKQKAFVAYLIEVSGAQSEDELNQFIQELGEEGLQEQYQNFEQSMQGSEQVSVAANGAKLNYIKTLRGQCPEGFEMSYFKKGGVICSKCMKKADAQKANPEKAAKGTKVVNDFKVEMDKCGSKMKKKVSKKQEGGKTPKTDKYPNEGVMDKDHAKKYQANAKNWRDNTDYEAKAIQDAKNKKAEANKKKLVPKTNKVPIKKHFFGGKL
jgi:hypothetical protein|nr:MAG TPA: hypothetical protein [Caudoviricetes sp.]